MYSELLSGVAILPTIAAFAPYLHSILRRKTKPHVFSKVIWGSTTFIVFLAQLAGKGGAGARPMGVSGIITIIVVLLAYARKSDATISRIDWIFILMVTYRQ